MQVLEKGKYSGSVTTCDSSETITASITTYDAHHFNDKLHCHANAHFSFALAGGCVEKKKQAYEITPGTITYYSAGELHQVLKIPVQTRRINLELEDSFFHRYSITDEYARIAITTNPDAKFLMVKVCSELLTGDNFSQVSIQMLLLRLFHQPGYQHKKLLKQPNWVQLVKEYLHDYVTDSINLNELANVAGLHPVSLSRQFPNYFHCTIGEYKRKLKIEKSLALIKSPGRSLSDVAYTCGFFDQIHFTRNFKIFSGILPKQYRNL